MIDKIVIRYADGKIKKGTTQDFSPNKDAFHISNRVNGEYQKIIIRDLKAVFFVKNFLGNPKYQDRDDIERVGLGRKIKVHFKDGESMIGYSMGFSQERTGFMLFPSDPDSNNDKVFVVTAATVNVEIAP